MGDDDLVGPPPLEDLPILGVFIILRGNHHHPFAFVYGAGAVAVSTMVMGTATMGGGELGLGVA